MKFIKVNKYASPTIKLYIILSIFLAACGGGGAGGVNSNSGTSSIPFVSTSTPINPTNGKVKAKVAVIDTGIRPSHSAFKGSLAKYTDYGTEHNGGNGEATNSHGTWVSSIISGTRSSDYTKDEIQLYSIKTNDFIHWPAAFNAAKNQGVDIINFSQGQVYPQIHAMSEALISSLSSILTAGDGMLMVQSAGNDSTNLGALQPPAGYFSFFASDNLGGQKNKYKNTLSNTFLLEH